MKRDERMDGNQINNSLNIIFDEKVYKNVHIEVSDLLWENSSTYIYSCKILNPIESLPTRVGNCIALHSNSVLSKNTRLVISIETIDKSKYQATYKLVSSCNNEINTTSEEKVKLRESEDFILDEIGLDLRIDDEREAESMGMDLEDYYEFQDYEANRDPEDY